MKYIYGFVQIYEDSTIILLTIESSRCGILDPKFAAVLFLRHLSISGSSSTLFENMAHFDPPQIQENPNGWGPCQVPEKFKDMPYQPFSKDVRLGKVTYADAIQINL